ncbi:MAG: nucleotidyl transferase AbiEii/AbiGii toxin family protein [Candidatus Contendobacter sp.]|nr:nucleotidyl transferase AbiEii/AbiGii toxin family protein [Candidatus Contendobacter sp.]
MFERPRHQKLAQVLFALNGPLLRENHCLFGGGTAMALRYGEYRESVDLDFLVSDVGSYRTLRQLLTGPQGITTIIREGATPLAQTREVRADQYGIRTMVQAVDQPIKFEIILEGRIELTAPASSDEVCGIATLTPLDMATSKLLANSDRWGDDGVFSRDLIDLAMMSPPLSLLRPAVAKAEQAYGKSILQDLEKAINRMQTRHGWLDRCIQTLAMNLPKVQLWQKIRALRRVLTPK